LKSLLVFVLSLSSTLAFAQGDLSVFNISVFSAAIETTADTPLVDLPLPQTGSTRLEALESWYNQGSPLTFAEFKGYYSGRCFSRSDKNKPMAAMIGYYSKESKNDDAGPGFNEPNQPKIGGLLDFNSASSPTYFDDEANAETRKNELTSRNAAIYDNVSKYSESPTLSFTVDWEPNGNPDEKHELKAYKGYIVDRWTAQYRQKYGNHGVLNPGDTLFMCYFFKKLGE